MKDEMDWLVTLKEISRQANRDILLCAIDALRVKESALSARLDEMRERCCKAVCGLCAKSPAVFKELRYGLNKKPAKLWAHNDEKMGWISCKASAIRALEVPK